MHLKGGVFNAKMTTRFRHDLAYQKDLEKVLQMYIAKSRVPSATDVLMKIYELKQEMHKEMGVRQYMLVRRMDLPKSSIQEILKDLETIRAIRNVGSKTVHRSEYFPSLDELGQSLNTHARNLKALHEELLVKDFNDGEE